MEFELYITQDTHEPYEPFAIECDGETQERFSTLEEAEARLREFFDAPNGYGNPDDDEGELAWFLTSGRIIA